VPDNPRAGGARADVGLEEALRVAPRRGAAVDGENPTKTIEDGDGRSGSPTGPAVSVDAANAADAPDIDLSVRSLQPRWRTRRILLMVASTVAAVLIGIVVWYWRMNAGLVKTDNAQTAGDLSPISAQISGTVVRIDVVENTVVKKGAVLVALDPTDYNLTLARARSTLAAARAQVEAARAALSAQTAQFHASMNTAESALQAAQPLLPQAQAQLRMSQQTSPAQIAQAREQVTTAQANVEAAKADLDTATKTMDRDRTLLAQGAIAAQQVDTDTAAFEAARARYQSAQDALRQADNALVAAEASQEQVAMARQNVEVQRGQISEARAQLQQAAAGETLVEQRARELAVAEAQAANASAAVQAAQVNLDRTLIRAPADGRVTNSTVEVGQVVQPNQPFMSLTLSHRVWIVANVKETQLAAVRVGNPVRIKVDVLRGRALRGHVESIGSATGSTVALLPPDNATGNFIKVVQLVPVRILLDPESDPDPQLQVGLSCEVAIDTRQSR
jgi:membrane fusion protein, multidrug efflux system